ncbi:hypothetical protein [Kitasatospora sp. NPDC050543]|uniref:hypothetical protein n=1 Tax=Kitasatospora sp. NPDC050543 TaxID=3364054 RepID=UPI0037880E5C
MHIELPPLSGAALTSEHRVEISERGSFCFARCSCGWYSPARRSRDLARREGAAHLAASGAPGHV